MMKRIAIHKLLKLLLPLLLIIGGKQCCANTVSISLHFYHGDHLGSASWITDSNGTPLQHLQYMPYGEPLINERISSSSYEERYTFTGKERDSETGLSYLGARYYDSDILTGWLSVDPMADKYPGLSPYAYSNWNPVKLIDPDGNSPISVLAKMMLKRTAKEGVQIYAKKQIENRLKKYMTKDIAKQFAKDLDDILTIFDGNGWEMLLEAVPIVGDIYGGTKFTKDIVKAYERLQDLENKYVEKIYKSLPKEEAKRFKNAMRNAGVRDARNDQKNGVESLGETYVKGNNIEGHHKTPVSKDIYFSII